MWEKVLPERHEQRVFAFIIICYSILLTVCVLVLAGAVFFHETQNVEALTGLVAMSTTLLGSFTTLLAGRGIVNHKKEEPNP